MNAIRAYVATQIDQRTWDADLNSITCVLNNHVHTSTDLSLFMAVHGRMMITNGKEYGSVIDPNGMNESDDTHSDKMKVIRNLIREHLNKAFERISNIVNNRAGTRLIDPSKDTYLRNMKLSNAGERYSKKLGVKYLPVNIIRKVGRDTYLIADKDNKLLGKFHSSLLMQR